MNAASQDLPLPYLAVGDEIDLFEKAWHSRLPVLIKGPTGCGKTRFVEHMAARLGRPLFTISCHDDLSATDLVGRHLIAASGTFWQDGPLTCAVRAGGICYLDEIVEARKDTSVVLHALSDDRRLLPIERTGEQLQAPPEFMLVVSYNPGYQHLLKGLKPSTRQRFVSLRFDHPDLAQEEAIISAETGLASDMARRLALLAEALRQSASDTLDEVPGTRLIVGAGRLIAAGCAPRQACRAGIIECLSDDTEQIAAMMRVVDMVMGS